jgi:RNA polymerase sigma-70 factor (ECF subfamily)
VLSAAEILVLQRMRADETAVYDELVRTHLASIYRVARRMLRDPAEAAEVTVDVFVRLCRGGGQYEGACSVKTWVLRIAFSEIQDPLRWVLRRCRRLIPLTDDFARSEDRGTRGPGRGNRGRELEVELPTAVAPQEMDRDKAIRRALEKLPSRRRSVVVLRDVEGCSYDEIAEILAISTGAVTRRLAKARAALKRCVT